MSAGHVRRKKPGNSSAHATHLLPRLNQGRGTLNHSTIRDVDFTATAALY
jgi:hypothetical protein